MDNSLKEYITPKLIELGNLKDVTQWSWTGENSDGGFPDSFPEAFGS